MRRDRGDETSKMVIMNRWLDAVCAELDVDRSIMDANTTALLRLISDVAHGPSRPGAPLTAFLVGLAGASDPSRDTADVVADRIAAVSRLVSQWDAPPSEGAVTGGAVREQA